MVKAGEKILTQIAEEKLTGEQVSKQFALKFEINLTFENAIRHLRMQRRLRRRFIYINKWTGIISDDLELFHAGIHREREKERNFH